RSFSRPPSSHARHPHRRLSPSESLRWSDRGAIARPSYSTCLIPPNSGHSPDGLRLAEVGMPAFSDAVAELFQGARRPVRGRQPIAQRRGEGLTQLLQGAAEELAGRLEFGAQPEKAEAVVARDVEAAAELAQQQEQALPALRRESGEPGVEQRLPARIHHSSPLYR